MSAHKNTLQNSQYGLEVFALCAKSARGCPTPSQGMDSLLQKVSPPSSVPKIVSKDKKKKSMRKMILSKKKKSWEPL